MQAGPLTTEPLYQPSAAPRTGKALTIAVSSRRVLLEVRLVGADTAHPQLRADVLANECSQLAGPFGQSDGAAHLSFHVIEHGFAVESLNDTRELVPEARQLCALFGHVDRRWLAVSGVQDVTDRVDPRFGGGDDAAVLQRHHDLATVRLAHLFCMAGKDGLSERDPRG
jgi:hypothetical protein